VGGEQKNYPASKSYGPVHFDPPLEINGWQEVEKLTWIRGAHRVVIGPKETAIEWYPQRKLVIPRFRIDEKKPVNATLAVPETTIRVEQELTIDVKQYGDGRHFGGIRVEKRHPDWKPIQEPQEYDLWLRVIHGETMAPLVEAPVNILRWDPAALGGKGAMKLVKTVYTDGAGTIHEDKRPSGELEAVAVGLKGYHVESRCFQPLPGQQVRFHMRAWPLRSATIPYRWRRRDTVEAVALLSGSHPQEFFAKNRIKAGKSPAKGMRLSLPCYAATYIAESRDALMWLVDTFGYAGLEELAKVNGVSNASGLFNMAVNLPGWYYVYARPGDSLHAIEKMFDLPEGSARIVSAAHHPDPQIPYPSETVAVPAGRCK
jgi:hypothetical protein